MFFHKLYIFILLFIFHFCFFSQNLFSDEGKGCEFIFSIPPVYEEQSNGNFVTICAIALEDCEISVEVQSLYFNKKRVKKNETVFFQIDASFGQVSNWTSESKHSAPSISGIYKNSAITVNSSNYILCYVLCQYYWTGDGFVAFPTSVLGNKYIVSSYSDMGSYYGHYYPSELTISGIFDNTNVEFIVGGNSATNIQFQDSTYYLGDTILISLNKKDVCLLMSGGILKEYPDLSGSRINSNYPIAVNSGNVCANIPVKSPSCDYIVTMDYPTYMWTNKYLIPPISRRKFSQIVRIYAKEDSTIIYHNYVPIDTLFNSYVQNEGWCEIRLNGMKEPKPTVISSNNPIYVIFYYPSWTEDSTMFSDPFMMPIVPLDMFNKNVIFSTPKKTTVSSFDSNFINIVYKSNNRDTLSLSYFNFQYVNDMQEFEEISLDDLEIVSSGPFPFENGSNDRYYYLLIKLPKIGQYYISSKKLFACYLFGCSDFTSFGFPTYPIDIFFNDEDIEAPTMLADINCDGSVFNGIVKDLPEKKLGRSNLNSIVFIEDESNNVEFSYSPFTPGISYETYWNLNVIDIKYDATATVKVSDVAENEETFVFNYYGLKGINLLPVRDSICLDYYATDSLIFDLYNPKDTSFNINIYLNTTSENLRIKSKRDIELKPKSSERIVFETKFVDNPDTLFLVLEKCDNQDTIWLPIKYKLIHYPVNVILKTNKKIYSIGDTIYCNLILNTNANKEDLSKINSIDVEFNICNVFANINENNFIYLPTENFTLKNVIIERSSEELNTKLNFTIFSSDGIFKNIQNNKSLLCNIKLLLVLPNNSSNYYGEYFSIKPEFYYLNLKPNITSNFFPCVSFNSLSQDIKIDPICADNLRLLNITDHLFDVKYEDNNILYSIGLDGYIEIKIYNSIANIVYNKGLEYKRAGVYNLNIKELNLVNGLYFFELNMNGVYRKFINFIKL